MQLEAVSATVLLRGALNTTILSKEKQNAANTRETSIAICHPAQQRITRSYTAANITIKYYVGDTRRPNFMLTSCTGRRKTFSSRSN